MIKVYDMKTIELAKKYKVTRQCVELWRKAGLPYIKLGDKTFRYDRREVHQWLLQKGSNQLANRGVLNESN